MTEVLVGPWPQVERSTGAVEKVATGIDGFDEITAGGLPRGRATVVTGAAGSGKSMFGVEFLARGVLAHDEPGVLLSFEETTDELVANARSLGFDLEGLVAAGSLVVDSAVGQTDDLVQSGTFDLEGLMVRIRSSVAGVGARRIVLDTVETLFAALPDEVTVRREFGRLLRWLKGEGLSVVVTAERGEGGLTRHRIEEYVSDCVIVLDHELSDETATRRLRVAKYRGTPHATNAFPFLITSRGLRLMPLHQAESDEVSSERLGLGISRLDEMLGGGIFRGSALMISGSAGTGKTSIAAAATAAACERGERALFVSLEEPSPQIVRNMRSIGIDFRPWLDRDLLRIVHMRPTVVGLEEHLESLETLVVEHGPALVVVDAVGSLARGAGSQAGASVIARDIAMLRGHEVTTILTSLATEAGEDRTQAMASSLVDAWLLVRNQEADGERTRLLFAIKNRGSAHSNQVREFVLTDEGPQLVDVFVGPDGVLTGSRRQAQVDHDARARRALDREAERKRARIADRTAEVAAQVDALRRGLAAEVAELEGVTAGADADAHSGASDRRESAQRRGGGPV